MTARAGERLVCFADTTICDGRGEHDVRVWTDGIVGFADAAGPEGRAQSTIYRDTHWITVECGVILGYSIDGDPYQCTGHATFDLTDESWTADGQAVGMLNSYGERIES